MEASLGRNRDGLSRRGRGVLAFFLLAAALTAMPAAAEAKDATSRTVRELARRAVRDPSALAELKRIDSVDGRRVDLRRALAGAEGVELSLRLETLAAEEAGETRPAPLARREAREILAERRFHEARPPRPFRGILEWLGARLRPVGDAIGWLTARVPGGESAVWALLAAAVVAFSALLTARLARRRTARVLDGRSRQSGAPRRDARRLEREADEAEERGDLAAAIRLRFRAGLIRLDDAGAIELRDSLTTGDVRRRLRSGDFDRVAATFDAVVYGRRRPEPPDAREAREGWERLLEAVRAR